MLAIVVVAVGFYRGWFVVSNPTPNAGGNKVDVNLTLDRGKMQEDADAVKKSTSELLGKDANPAPKPAAPVAPGR